MTKNNARKGSSMVELVMVLMLLAIFGVTIYTLIQSGVGTQRRIMEQKDAQMDARIAMNYINVRLRQSDMAGKVAVEKIDITGENALLIKERTIDYEYDTWIYCLEGKLYECLVNPGEQPKELDSFYVVDIERLEIETDPESGTIKNTVYYNFGDKVDSMSSTIFMRSSQSESITLF